MQEYGTRGSTGIHSSNSFLTTNLRGEVWRTAGLQPPRQKRLVKAAQLMLNIHGDPAKSTEFHRLAKCPDECPRALGKQEKMFLGLNKKQSCLNVQEPEFSMRLYDFTGVMLGIAEMTPRPEVM